VAGRRFLVVFAPVLLAGCVWIARSSVSSGSPGVEGNQASGRPSLSEGGRFVAFDSLATNLVAGDSNGVADVFVRDHVTKSTERVSVATDGTQANGPSRNASISDDGRFVAFETDASNLFANDTNNKTDIVVRDRQLNTTIQASLDRSGQPITDATVTPVISGNGRFVAFNVNASLGSFCCVMVGPYVRDLVAGTTTAMPTAGGFVTGPTTLSDDGSRIAYGTVQPPPDPTTERAPYAVVVADVPSATVIATIDSGILTPTQYFDPALSGDGTKVAYVFVSNGVGTLSTYDLTQPGLHQTLTGLGSPGQLALSDDGAVIAARIANPYRYVVTDPTGSPPRVVSASASGTIASSVEGTDLSGDGRWVAFATPDPNMVAGDANGVSDGFVRSVGQSNTGPT
jgi:Tol biopolymer transport system component